MIGVKILKGGKYFSKFGLLALAVILGIEIRNYGQKNNSCTDYESYFNLANNEKCFYNPDIEKDTPELLETYFNVYETFNVITDDGYILTIFHVPKKGARGVVVLFPPASADSVVWMGQSNESFAVILHNAGYDVWLPNHRGTKYSMDHVNKTIGSNYWDYSFHEIGLYDYSAFTKLIKQETGRSDLIFIGHSMSATAGIIYAALKPEEVLSSYKVMIHSCPPVYYKHKSLSQQFHAKFAQRFKFVIDYLGLKSILTPGCIFEKFYKLPRNGAILKYVAKYFIQVNSGMTSKNHIDPKYINLLFTHMPRGVSWQMIEHFSQFILYEKFQMFDYGLQKNLEIYNSSEPLEYPIKNVLVPSYLVISDNDVQSTIEDSYYLYNQLDERAKIYGLLHVQDVAHAGIFYGVNRFELVQSKILNFMNNITEN